MKSSWIQCLQNWKAAFAQTARASRRRMQKRFRSTEPREVQILEARLVLAADTDDQISEVATLGSIVDTIAQIGSISSVADEAADVDLYAVTAVSGQKVAIDVDHTSGELNSVLRIFDSTGRQIAMNDNAAAPGETLGTEAYSLVTFQNSGTYYIGVSGAGNTNYSATLGTGDRPSSNGDYNVTITPVDADDQTTEVASLGQLVSELKAKSSTIELPMDVDLFKFSAAKGQVIGVDVDAATGSSLDSYLRIFAADGTEIGTGNDNAAGPEEQLGNDSYLTFTAPEAGDFFVGVSNSANTAYSALTGAGDTGTGTKGGYAVVLTYLDSDDQLAEAKALAATIDEQTTSGSITQLADVNIYSFTAEAKQKIAFDVDHSGASWNSQLRVFGSNGSQVASNDNAAAPGETLGTEPYLVYEFRTAGTYYVALSSSGNSSYVTSTGLGDKLGTSTGDYTLTMTPIDADDQPAEAVSMGALLSRVDKSGIIDTTSDVDLFKFTASAGQTVGVDVDLGSGSTLNSYVRLFDETGAELAANDNAAGPGETIGTAAYATFTLTAGGNYYVGVSASGNTGYSMTTGLGDIAGDSTGSYGLQVWSLDADDELTEANSSASLGAITDDVTASRTIAYGSDVALMSFTASAGQRIAIDADHTTEGFNSFLRVFSSTGQQVASNDNAAAPGETLGTEAYVLFEVRTSGSYYVGLSGSGNSQYIPTTGLGDKAGSTGSATITLSPADIDDSTSEAVSLGTLTSTLTRSAVIDSGLDVDFFSFTAYAGQDVGIDIDRPSGSLDSRLRLFNAAGDELATSNDEAAPEESAGIDAYISYSFTTTATYYIGVSAAENTNYSPLTGSGDTAGSTFGAYSIILTSLDSDDQITEANDLGSASDTLTRVGTINLSTDVDLVKFAVGAGQRLEFDIDHTNGSTLNSNLRIFDSTGRQLASNDNAAGPGETLGSEAYLAFTFTTGGTYYAGISNTGNRNYNATTGLGDAASTSNATGEYTLTVSSSDSDDQISEAVSIGSLSALKVRSATIETTRDVDMYSFTVTAGQHVGFDIDTANGSTLDSYVTLFDASGNSLATNNDGTATNESASADSYLTYTFSSAGTYYLAVSSAANTAFSPTAGTGDSVGSTGAYTLTAQGVPNNLGFEITLSFGSGLTDSQKVVFQQAANRWAEIILGDLPDVTLPNGTVIDDVLISASGISIDGPYGILGQAGPTQLRSDTYLPYQGDMQFDSADLANMESNGSLYPVILHEMGHVLGIGTLWQTLRLLSGAGTSNPIFTGAQATAAYNRIFGVNAAGVPVENSGGSGTRDAHWRESTMPYEIMTGYISSRNYLTEITIGSLADMGYFVDLGAADAYVF